MIYINLLPVKDIKRRNQARREFCFLAILFSVVLVALVASTLYLYVEQSEQEQNNRTLASKLKKAEEDVKNVETINSEIQEQTRRIDTIKKMRTSSERTVQVFVDLANYIPTNRIWLTQLDRSQKDNTLTLQGIALDNSTVALYLDDLKKVDDVDDAVLVETKSEKYNERTIVRFRIRCLLKDLSV